MSVNPTDQEDAYFRKQDQELRQRLRDQLTAAAGQLDQQTRSGEVPLAERIKALGFTGEKARVFDLMPLIHVAWADGSVSRQERSTILEVVTGRGIRPGSDAFILVESLLEERPSQEFLEQSISILKLAVGEAVADHLAPIRERYHELLDDPSELERILAVGADRAREVASATLARVVERVGLLPAPARANAGA